MLAYEKVELGHDSEIGERIFANGLWMSVVLTNIQRYDQKFLFVLDKYEYVQCCSFTKSVNLKLGY